MERLRRVVVRVAGVMDVVGGVVLTFMMLVTVLDVILRYIGTPFTGTYELVYLGGAVVIAFAMPRTSWEGANVNVDFVVEGMSRTGRKAMFIFARLFGIVFFAFLGVNLFRLSATLFAKHEVSLTLHVPIYPVVFALGVCAFVESLVLLSMLVVRIVEVKDE